MSVFYKWAGCVQTSHHAIGGDYEFHDVQEKLQATVH
jgi:hypothetical protein